MTQHWTDRLPGGTDKEFQAWALLQPDFNTAWKVCARGDWMLWLLGRLSGPAESESRRKLVAAVCECARVSLHIFESRDRVNTQPRRWLESAEAHARGEMSLDELRYDGIDVDLANANYTTPDLASASAYVAACVANATAYDSVVAPYVALNVAAAFGTDDERPRILLECADIVRRHYHEGPPVLPETKP